MKMMLDKIPTVGFWPMKKKSRENEVGQTLTVLLITNNLTDFFFSSDEKVWDIDIKIFFSS